MKKSNFLNAKRAYKLMGAVLTAGLFSTSVWAVKPGETDGDPAFNGNGAPSGKHFNLNLIGMSKPKGKSSGAEEDQTTNGNGRRIFVILEGGTKIYLTPGEFDVIDYDGTDGSAVFQLPIPEEELCSGITTYSVYARALTPGSAKMYSCAIDLDGTEWCSIQEEVTVELSKSGKPMFENVSRELLYVYIDTNGEDPGGKVRVPLFDDSGETYWWQYDNKGLRLAQLRFYPISTNTNLAEDPYTCGKFPIEE